MGGPGRRTPAAASEALWQNGAGSGWAALPQDLRVLVCQLAGPRCSARLGCASRRARELARDEAVWRCFCGARWGRGANLHAYQSARDLYLDGNGWFPRSRGQGASPAFEVRRVRLHASACTTMDLSFAGDEVIVVSEAPRDGGPGRPVGVQVVDYSTGEVRQHVDVSDSTINCCDAANGLVCLGSNDCKVHLLRRLEASHGRCGDGCAAGEGYHEVCAYPCLSEVNDLRLAREDAVIAVRTYPNRHPAGLDLIPLHRPEARVSFPGGARATMCKYIHALDGFEEGCSLSSVVCTGEHASTSAFSIMLFDFRRQSPCVVDLPMTSAGQPSSSMLWPLRAGPSPIVYANMDTEPRHGPGSKIAMIDFRYPTIDSQMQLCFPERVDDFRCFGGSLYAACSLAGARQRQTDILRCRPGGPREVELLLSMVGACTASGRSPHEDLKVLAVSQRGFAFSYGEHLLLGSVAEARRPGRLGARCRAAPATPPRCPSCL